MSSHIRRLQYQQQQQRQAQLGRTGSSSSLRLADAASYPASIQDDASVIQSIISGSTDFDSQIRPLQQVDYAGIPIRGVYANATSQPSSPFGRGIGSGSGYSDWEKRENGSMRSYQASTVAGKSILSRPSLYARSNLNRSRSLGASRASLVTVKSGRSTIQMEHHDRKVQQLINAVDFKRAKKPYAWSVTFFTLFLLTLFVGLLIICLRHVYMNIILSVDVGEAVGPMICAGSFLFLGAGMKFLYDAYQMGAFERQKIKYLPASASTVAVKMSEAPHVDAMEGLASGKTTDKALSRAPIGARTVMPAAFPY